MWPIDNACWARHDEFGDQKTLAHRWGVFGGSRRDGHGAAKHHLNSAGLAPASGSCGRAGDPHLPPRVLQERQRPMCPSPELEPRRRHGEVPRRHVQLLAPRVRHVLPPWWGGALDPPSLTDSCFRCGGFAAAASKPGCMEMPGKNRTCARTGPWRLCRCGRLNPAPRKCPRQESNLRTRFRKILANFAICSGKSSFVACARQSLRQ
jgi:hypothetical protein